MTGPANALAPVSGVWCRALALGAVVDGRESVNDETRREYTQGFINALHDRLAVFAQESFGLHGRGVVLVEAPEPPPAGQTIRVYGDLVYHTLEDLRPMFAPFTGEEKEGADVLLRMTETYDPFKQAVIMVGFKKANPISMKMRLAEPLIDE